MKQQRWTSLDNIRGVALLAVAMLAFGGGAAIAAIMQGDAAVVPSQADENAQWQSVAKGRDASFGRYEIFRADVAGKDCIGLRLPDQDPPGVARAIDASCLEGTPLQVGFIRGKAGTLAFGVASDETQSVTLTGVGQSPRQGSVLDGGPANTKFVLVSSPERLANAEVRAVDGAGRPIGSQTAPE